GGNAILRPGQRGTAEEQSANIRRSSRQIAEMVARGHEVVVTHGNGPQVGNILLQNLLARDAVPALPLDVCGAESQGELGYLFQQALGDELRRRGSKRAVVSLVTQTVVAADDPAFAHPSKPVGPFLDAEAAHRRMAEGGEAWMEDAGRGWRRVVPSPRPLETVEAEAIRALQAAGVVVIASGGGGVPVVRRADGSLRGVEAVIDKDLAAARLAGQLRMEVLLILTDVRGVAVDYHGPGQRFLEQVSVGELNALLGEGAFPAGSMGPKVAGAINFVRGGGRRAVICALDDALAGLDSRAGTQVVFRRSRTRFAA
ncbi:MAG: carbamate kinase, partial [Chloroflexota bacterium]